MDKTFIEKILEIQSELKAPKNSRNNFGGYNYRSAEQILEAVKPILKAKGVLLTLSDEVVSVDGWHYVRSIATLTDGENSISVDGYAREEVTLKGMTQGQITGSCSSYARKYALNGLFDIDNSEQDLDNENIQSKVKANVDKVEITALEKACKEKNIPLKEVLDYAKVDKAESLTLEEWADLMKKVEKAKKRE